jgi:mycothiol synthase
VWIPRLSPAQAEAVLALAERARHHDGVDPLNEEAQLSLSRNTGRHLLTASQGRLVGYFNHLPALHTGQLVVDPQHRRQGIGSDLWRQAPKATGLWSFADLLAARSFAAAVGLRRVRGLAKMARPLAGFTRTAPSGLRFRGYQPGDETELLAVNAAAFAHHPEQGALDATGLAARFAEPWFDPDGLILGFDAEGLAGFHWTKVDGEVGEVYVVAVAPRAQGRGYGKALLEAGMSHLAAQHLPTVVLYVDTVEEIAVRMYERAGFHTEHQDVFYAPALQEQS